MIDVQCLTSYCFNFQMEMSILICTNLFVELLCLVEVYVDGLVSELDSKKYKGFITLN